MVGLANTGGGTTAQAPIAAYFAHRANGDGTAYVTPTGNARVSYDRDYFTYSSGVFTTKQACSVTLSAFASGRHNASTGSSNTITHQILVNSTSLGESTSVTSSTTRSLSVGDTVQVQCKGTTAGACAVGLGIKLNS